MHYTYLKPSGLEKLGEGVLIVRGSKWLRQKCKVYLRNSEERGMLVQKLINAGAREEGTQNQQTHHSDLPEHVHRHLQP